MKPDYSYRFLQKIKAFADENRLFDACGDIIVGLSGGADSVCLFMVLCRLRETYGFRLHALHVHHGIRGQSADNDAIFSEELCKREAADFTLVKADVPAFAKENGLSLEEAGRKIRYEAFGKEAGKYGADVKTAVAHHMNDQAETVIFNMIRGSGLKGMGGMPPENDGIIRPLLCVTREEIERYLSENKAAFCIDETNLEDEYTRNAIRHKILPELDKIQPKSALHIADMAAEMREAENYFGFKAEEFFQKNVKTYEEGFFIDLKEFKKEKAIMQRHIIFLVMSRVMPSINGFPAMKDITRTHIEDVRLLKDKGRGKEIILPKGAVARRVDKGIYMARLKG